eukprot:1188624-Prorocentrum_minimum.AAC.2
MSMSNVSHSEVHSMSDHRCQIEKSELFDTSPPTGVGSIRMLRAIGETPPPVWAHETTLSHHRSTINLAQIIYSGRECGC